ncbi:MAG: sulfite exporter TauE/SafE family protein [Candidatus Hydrogenedentes bacterium]|nr:sulfite exporter TauE/SafE family protein [Candidatus Hydrogenedentota bacterium]
MSAGMLPAGAAAWLGLLTSISPCLLATNVAAVSYLARRMDRPRLVLLACGFYIAGQALAFVLLAMLLVSSVLSVPVASLLLQKYMFRLLGPILLVCGVLLLEWVTPPLGRGRLKAWAQGHAAQGGLWVAALLGIVFAMSFCPTTAALFFGSLVPLAIRSESTVFLPFMYACGVALPVVVFSVLVALAGHWVGPAFRRVAMADRFARPFTGYLFLAIGLYFTVVYTLELL